MDRASGEKCLGSGVAGSRVSPPHRRLRVARQIHSPRACAALFVCALAATLSVSAAAFAEEGALLTRMLREGQSFQVRAGAAQLIGRRRDESRRPELEGALGDSHPTVRAAAASALGRIGSTESLPPLRGAAHDRVKVVATSAQAAIDTIRAHAPQSEPNACEEGATTKPRFGLMLGELHNQSAYVRPEVSRALGIAVLQQLQGVPGVVVFAADQTEQLQTATRSGLAVFRLDAAVTALSAIRSEGRLALHCEVALLVVDRATGSLRTLFKGAARAEEIPNGDPDAQQLGIAQRVVAAAVRSALRNADAALAVAVR